MTKVWLLLKNSKKYSLHNSQYSIQAGYTFVELLVVISIMSLISIVGIAAFVSFNNSQVVDGAASDVTNFYNLARQRALSQVKPVQCTAAQPLRGYQVVINTVSRTYQYSGVCGSTTYVQSQKTLPANVTFANTSPPNVFFSVPNATTSNQGTVTINGYGKTKRITISSSGTISTQ